MKDWGTYRKLYDNPPPAFERLPFAARCLSAELLRRCDRIGRIVPAVEMGDELISDLSIHVRARPSDVEFLTQAVTVLLEDEYLIFDNGYLCIRNFVDAQRSDSADRMARARQAKKTKGDLSHVADVTHVTDVTSHANSASRYERAECALSSSRIVSSNLSEGVQGEIPPTGQDTEPKPTKSSRRKLKREREPEPEFPLPSDWAPAEGHKARAVKLNLDLESEAIKFAAKAEEKGWLSARWNAKFTTWLENAATYRKRDLGPQAKPDNGLPYDIWDPK